MEKEIAVLREQLQQLQLAATKCNFELHLRKQIEELTKTVHKYGNESIDILLNRCTTIIHQTFNPAPNYCGIELLDDLNQQLVLRCASNIADLPHNTLSIPITYKLDGVKKTLQQFTLHNLDAPVIFSDINNDPRFDHAHDHHTIFPNTTSGISIALISEFFSEQELSKRKEEKSRIEKLGKGGEVYKPAIIGRFFVYFTDQHEFSDEELWFLNTAANLLTDAVTRHKLRNRLSESNERFRILADCSPVMLWMTDNSSLCTWFNKTWLTFRGRSLEEEYGNGWAEGIHPDDYHHNMRKFLLNFKLKKPFEAEYRMMHNDGEYCWIRQTGSPRISANGEFEGFIGSFMDITEIRESHRATFDAKQREESVHAKNKLIEQFVTDTRNPLESILAMNSLLLDMNLAPEQQSYAEGVQMGTELLVELFSDLYDLTRSEPTRTELEYNEFNIYEAIEPVVAFVSQSTRLKKLDVELVSSIEPKIPMLNGDLLRFKQIIMNLINNHLARCGDGTVIYIKTHIGSESDDKLQLKIDFKHVSGILRDTRRRSIMTFGEEALGVYIARQLVQAMNGDISFGNENATFCKVKLWFDKAENKSTGDMLVVEIPTDVEDNTSQSEDGETLFDNDLRSTQSPIQRYPIHHFTRDIRILIVDPHPVAIDTITAYLNTEPNYNIDSSISINEAVRMITHSLEIKTPYDLVLLDFKFETLGRFMMQSHPKMFKTTKWVPIIFPQDTTKLAALEWKYSNVVYKPIRMSNLLEAVSDTIMDTEILSSTRSDESVAQPIPRSSWTKINERPVAYINGSYPRTASFSDGSYVVVYTVVPSGGSTMQIAAKVFFPDGSVRRDEVLLTSDPGINNYSPNVAVLKGDIAVVVWRSNDGIGPVESFYGQRFLADLTSQSIPFKLFDGENTMSMNTNGVLGLFPLNMNNPDSFGYTLPPVNGSGFGTQAMVGFDQKVMSTVYKSVDLVDSVDTPEGIFDERTNCSYYLFKTQSNFNPRIVSYSGYEPIPSLQRTILPRVQRVTYSVPLLLDSTKYVLFVQAEVSSNSVVMTRMQQNTFGALSEAVFKQLVRSAVQFSAVHIGSNYVVLAHSSTLNTTVYQYLRVDDVQGLVLIGPQLSLGDVPTEGVHMTRLGDSSDIAMVAYSADQTQVLMRRLSLCGNGIIDMNEQCDGSPECTTQCMCVDGMEYRNGKCVDVCGNGIVTINEECDGGTGCDMSTCTCQAGFQPYVIRQECRKIPSKFIPSVGPSLDCLNIIDNSSMILYFSFVNNEGFGLTIPFGELNEFIPSDLAVDRPTVFAVGNSLTYPVSPYNVTVPRSTGSIAWLLGSYNLTVDLSGNKAQALQCPKDAGFVITIATFDTLNKTDVQTVLNNLATRYNFSASRLDATYRLSAAGNETQPNIYSISVTIFAATNSSDKSVQEILSELFSDLKDAKQDLDADLTQGLDGKNPIIKDVSPSPTGVEVRGQERDIPPTAFEPISDPLPAVSAAALLRPFVAVLFGVIFVI